MAVPLLFLAKLGIEKAIYDSNKTPEVNPNPKEKLRIFGKFPFENEIDMNITILYINKNPECDRKLWLAGTQFPQTAEKNFSTNIENEVFESNIYLDSFLPGVCKWKAYNIYAYMQSKKDDMAVNRETIMFNNGQIVNYIPTGVTRSDNKKVLQEGVRQPARIRIGTIAFKTFTGQGKLLKVKCKKEKSYKNRKSLLEISWTGLGCNYINEDDNSVRLASDLIPNVSSLQKTVEINFIDKGWEK